MIAAWQEGGPTCIQVFFFRNDGNYGNRAYFPSHDKSTELPEVLAAFMGQFYDNKPPPRLILVSHEPTECELIGEALSRACRRQAWRSLVPAARRQAQGGGARPAQRARGAGAPHRPNPARRRSCCAASPTLFGLDQPPRAHRGLRQQPHLRHQPVWRHDRRRARRLHEEPAIASSRSARRAGKPGDTPGDDYAHDARGRCERARFAARRSRR